jgi:arylsulfatase A-like enzyme
MPIRSGTSRVPLPGLPQGPVPWEYTIAELLRDAGYQSALYGKWHLSDRERRYPTNQGFDEWYGFPHSTSETLGNIQPGYVAELAPNQGLWEGRVGEPSKRVGDYDYAMRPLMDAEITRRSVDYIKAHARDAKPFFLYVPFSLPHAPPVANPKYRLKDKTDYQNVLHEIDQNAGAILDAIDAAVIRDNTIVVFTSDNGPETHVGYHIAYGAMSDTGPFRGEFPSGWEGAIRVPFIVRWPGRVQPGRVSNEIMSMLDMYRTFAHVAGASNRVPTDRPIDSIDQTDFLFGNQEASNRDFAIFFHGTDLLSIKRRRYKRHFNIREPSRGDVRNPGQQMLTSDAIKPNLPFVFDIENDPKEMWNLNGSGEWIAMVVAKTVAMPYVASLKDHPNIKPGAAGPEEKDPIPSELPAMGPRSE